MERLRLLYNTSQISYLRFGSGPKLAFCFHGYGEEAGYFAFLENAAGDKYSFFAIDLPFHGHTEWNDRVDCSTNDIRQIIERILQIDQQKKETSAERVIDPVSNSQLTLVGFSLGGRVVLSLHQMISSRVEKLVLLAPDGLKVNFWYWLSTQTLIGNALFVFTMKHPQWFFFSLKMLNKLKLVNASIFKFVSFYIGDEPARNILYQRWTVLRKLKPRIKEIKTLIAKNGTPVRFVYGKHDRIILPVRGEKFMKGIEKQCTLTVIASGHQVLHEKHSREILQALLH